MTVLVAENPAAWWCDRPFARASGVAMEGNLLDAEFAFDAGEYSRPTSSGSTRCSATKRRWVEPTTGSVSEIQDAVTASLRQLTTRWFRGRPRGRDVRARVAAGAPGSGRVERWVDAGVGARPRPAVEAFRTKLRALAVRADPELPRGLRSVALPLSSGRRGVAPVSRRKPARAACWPTTWASARRSPRWRYCSGARRRDGAAPSLVVAPTSVAGNWGAQAARFAPASVLLYHGAARGRRVGSRAPTWW